MKPTEARTSTLKQVLGIATALLTAGTITVEGQAPKKAPAAATQSGPLPVYPGATFDAQTSAGMTAGMSSGGRDSFFVYLTSDPAAKVAAFYTSKTGKQAQKVEEGSFAFFVSDTSSAMPDLTVQSNLEGPLAGKTVITIVKHKR